MTRKARILRIFTKYNDKMGRIRMNSARKDMRSSEKIQY